jgi:hypothetical protein
MSVLAIAARAQAGPLQRTEGHERLQFLVGDWDTSLSSPDGKVIATGRVTYGWEVGGIWLMQRYQVEFPGIGTRHELGVMTFDAQKDSVMGYWVDNLSARLTPFTGRLLDSNTLVIRLPDVTTRNGSRVSSDVVYHQVTMAEIQMTQRQWREGEEGREVARLVMRRR